MINVQSCCKPISYAIALEEHGDINVHNFVSIEPSGRNFNDMCLNSQNIPFNPCINSGAIITTSLIKAKLKTFERFE